MQCRRQPTENMCSPKCINRNSELPFYRIVCSHDSSKMCRAYALLLFHQKTVSELHFLDMFQQHFLRITNCLNILIIFLVALHIFNLYYRHISSKSAARYTSSTGEVITNARTQSKSNKLPSHKGTGNGKRAVPSPKTDDITTPVHLRHVF